jgi:(2Fe-2S) ferredoxin
MGVDHATRGCEPAAMPQRDRYLFVCTNRRAEDDEKGSCAERGSEAVREALKKELAARGLARLQARVCASTCLDQCSAGVTILVEPDHYFLGRVTVGDVTEIAEGLAAGRRVERLVLTAEDLARG